MEEGALWHHPQQWAPSLCKSISWCSAPQRQDLLLLLLALLPRGVPHLHHWEPDRAEECISRPPYSHWPSSRTFFTTHNSLNYEGHDTVGEDPGAPSNFVFRSTTCKLPTNFFVGYLDKMMNVLPPPFSENTSLLQAWSCRNLIQYKVKLLEKLNQNLAFDRKSLSTAYLARALVLWILISNYQNPHSCLSCWVQNS